VVVEVVDYHLTWTQGFFPDHYFLLLIHLLLLHKFPCLLNNSHKSLCPLVDSQPHHIKYSVY
jgi:hypothetical protein